MCDNIIGVLYTAKNRILWRNAIMKKTLALLLVLALSLTLVACGSGNTTKTFRESFRR